MQCTVVQLSNVGHKVTISLWMMINMRICHTKCGTFIDKSRCDDRGVVIGPVVSKTAEARLNLLVVPRLLVCLIDASHDNKAGASCGMNVK
jgi:hypothetical protein